MIHRDAQNYSKELNCLSAEHTAETSKALNRKRYLKLSNQKPQKEHLRKKEHYLYSLLNFLKRINQITNLIDHG